jgi:ribose 5-phosphate isomerase A
MKDQVDAVARAAASRVENRQIVGLGTGSTASRFIECLGERISREGLSLCGIPSSYQTAELAERVGIKVLSPCSQWVADLTVDGADEVDPMLNLIKGGGGALLNEKIVARRSKRFVIIVTEEKLVEHLGARHHLPVEVVPEAKSYVEQELKRFNPKAVRLRCLEGRGPVFTEHQNLLLDAYFDRIEPELENTINTITGVVENGLFTDFWPEVLVGKADGVWSYERQNGSVAKSKL